MQLETMRSLIDWLQYGTNGPSGALNGPSSANALAASVLRDAGDAAPTTIRTFGDETRTPVLARREIPRESAILFPLLGVIGNDPGDLDGEVETSVRDGALTVTIVYAHQQVLTEQGLRDWHYTARALQQSVRQWLSNANASFRTRNSIAVRACLRMTLQPPFTMKGDVQFAGGLSLHLSVRDSAP